MKISRYYLHPILVGSVVLGLQCYAGAQESTTRPVRPNNRPGLQAVRERMNETRQIAPNPNINQEPPTDEEWTEVSSFVSQTMPNRWAMFEEIRKARKEDAKVVQNIKQKLTNRYRMIVKAKGDGQNQNLYDSLVEQAKKEDDVLGSLAEFRKSPDQTNREAFREKVRDKVKALVNNLLEERQRRIDQMRENLHNEEDRLSRDRERIDDIVNNRLESVLNNDRPYVDIIPQGGGGVGKPNPGPRKNNDEPANPPQQPEEPK